MYCIQWLFHIHIRKFRCRFSGIFLEACICLHKMCISLCLTIVNMDFLWVAMFLDCVPRSPGKTLFRYVAHWLLRVLPLTVSRTVVAHRVVFGFCYTFAPACGFILKYCRAVVVVYDMHNYRRSIACDINAILECYTCFTIVSLCNSSFTNSLCLNEVLWVIACVQALLICNFVIRTVNFVPGGCVLSSGRVNIFVLFSVLFSESDWHPVAQSNYRHLTHHHTDIFLVVYPLLIPFSTSNSFLYSYFGRVAYTPISYYWQIFDSFHLARFTVVYTVWLCLCVSMIIALISVPAHLEWNNSFYPTV